MEKKQLLIIEDDEDVCKELKRVFEIDEEIGFEVTTAGSVKEAEESLKKTKFEVAIIDLQLPESKIGGLEIMKIMMECFRTLSPAVVSLFYTAYPSLETCVEAMRLGAWDYIDKNSKDSMNRLKQSVKQGLTRRFSPDTGPDTFWLEEHLPELKRKYPERWVALIDGNIADGDENLDKLKEMMKEKYPDKKPFYLWIPRW